MGRQDLLDQRRAGARHAKDEDWIGCRRSAGRACQRLGGTFGDTAVDRPRNLRWPVGLALEAQRVGSRIMQKGLVALAEVVKRLAEREVEMEAILFAKSR